jgi:hypothetical protein
MDEATVSMMPRIVTFLLLLCPSFALAQGTAPVDSGVVVRLHLGTDTTRRGRLLAPIVPASLTITYCRYPGPPCSSPTSLGLDSIPTSDVIHLDVASGSHWKRGALIGGGIGAALGGLFIAFAHSMCETSECRSSADTGALITAGLGLTLGAAFGSTSLTWKPVW